jgi:tetratricopeptide (TPR) repeat protein
MSENKPTSSLKVKIAIAIASLLFCLVLLEIILRIIGQLYLSREIINYGDPKSTDCVILCVGDSFTWGGGVSRYETYPAYLSEIIKSKNPHKKFLVINKGKCEYNSSQVLKSIPRWLKMYRPNIVILLVGSSNRFNPWGYNSYKSPGLLSDLKDALDDLRTVKMLRLLATNLKAKFFYWDAEHLFKEEPHSIAGYNYNACFVYRDRGFDYIKNKQQIKSAVPNNKLSTSWYYYNTGKIQQGIELLQSAIKDNPHSVETLCALAYGYQILGDFQKAEKFLQQAQQLKPQSKFVRGQMDFFYRAAQKFYQRSGSLDLALEYFRKSIELNPEDYKNYYNLSQAYDLQSKYNADFFINFFQRLLQVHGRLKDNTVFMAYLNFFREKKINEDKINKWLENDLDKIVLLCKENSADVIIQNYPASFPMANNSLKDTAKRYCLTFVDNLEIFNQFSLNNETNVYLLDDSHCTAKGHEVMATNIYNALVTKKITIQ